MPDFTLETDRLVLRPPVPADLAWVLSCMNTPGVMRHLGGAVRDPDEVRRGFESDLTAFDTGGHRRWTIWLRDADCRIGRCGLFRVGAEAAPDALKGEAEIGWMLAEKFQGRGYATEAARAVLDFGFASLGLPAIHAQTSGSNEPSTRMMARLGLRRRADLDFDDPAYPPCDNPTTVYAITAPQWVRQRKARS